MEILSGEQPSQLALGFAPREIVFLPQPAIAVRNVALGIRFSPSSSPVNRLDRLVGTALKNAGLPPAAFLAEKKPLRAAAEVLAECLFGWTAEENDSLRYCPYRKPRSCGPSS